SAPTTAVPTDVPSSAPATSEPSSAPSSSPETGVPGTIPPGTLPTAVPPTNAPTTAPVTFQPSAAPTTLTPTLGPTGAPATSAPPTFTPTPWVLVGKTSTLMMKTTMPSKYQLMYLASELEEAGVRGEEELMGISFQFQFEQNEHVDAAVTVGWTSENNVVSNGAKVPQTEVKWLSTAALSLTEAGWARAELTYPARWDGLSNLVVELCWLGSFELEVSATEVAFDAAFVSQHDTLCTPQCDVWCVAAGVAYGIQTVRPVIEVYAQPNVFERCHLEGVSATTCSEFVGAEAASCCSRTYSTTLQACRGEIPMPFRASSPAFVLCPDECRSANEICASICTAEFGRASQTGLHCHSWYDESVFMLCPEPPCRSYVCEDDARCSDDLLFMCGVEAGLEDFPVKNGRIPFEAGTRASTACPIMCDMCVNDCTLQNERCGGPAMCSDEDGELNGIFECRCLCEDERTADSQLEVCPSDNQRCLQRARSGWCGYAPSSEGLCLSELPLNTESETFAEPFVLDDLCVCSAGGFSEGACSEENGACVKVKETPEPTPAPRDVPSLFDNALQVVVGHFLGFGNCVDAGGRQYNAFEKEVDGEVECRAWAVEFMKGRCGMIGAEHDGQTCRVLTTLTSAGEQDEAPGASFVARDGGEGNPVDVRPLDSALCFNYFAPSCSYSDDCTRCHEQACVSTVAAPGLCTSPDTDFECTPKCAGISFLRSCSATAREELSFVVVDDASEEEGVVEDARVHDFVVLGAEFATCEEAGHERITVEVDCKRALCQSADVVWILDKIPSNDSALVPSGCTAECSSLEGGVCQLRTATFNTNGLLACNEARRLGKQCLCKRYRGPVVSADTAGTCGDYDALPLFFVQTFGSCGSSSNKASYAVGPTPFEGVVPAYAITDVTTESNCRAAACFLLGFRSDEDSPLATFGGYSMPAGATAQVPYTGAGGWTGGCSFGESRAVFMPPSPCGDQQTRAACAATRGCRWSDGAGCAESTAGNTACSEERPCLCRRKDATLVEVVTGVELAVSEGQYKSMFRVPTQEGVVNAVDVLASVQAQVFDASQFPNHAARTTLVCYRSGESEPLQWCLNEEGITQLLAGTYEDIPFTATRNGSLFVQVRQQALDTNADALRVNIVAALEGAVYCNVVTVGASVQDPVCALLPTETRHCGIGIDYYDSGSVQECNPCALLKCTADYAAGVDENCDEFDIDVAAGESTTLVFSSLATSSTSEAALGGNKPSAVKVEKLQTSGAAKFAVMFGSYPSLQGGSFSPTSHFRSATHYEDEQAVLNACGPFAVTLAAEDDGGSVHLRVCHPRKPCPMTCDGAGADGLRHGACLLKIPGREVSPGVTVPAVTCECDDNFGSETAAGVDCRLCEYGRFPAPGPGVENACQKTCAVGPLGEVQGVYNALLGECICVGGWEGSECEECSPDKQLFGPYCNTSYLAASHEFEISLTSDEPFSPPPWRVVGGSAVSFAVLNDEAISRISNFTVTLFDSLHPPVDATDILSNTPPSKTNTIDAAYYAPAPDTFPGACSPSLVSGEVYVHILVGPQVHVFSMDKHNETWESTLHCSPPLAEYYAAWSISRCLSAFGEASVERVDAAFYQKNAGQGSDTFTLVKNNKLCTARGSPFKFGGDVVAVSRLFDLPGAADDAINVLHPGFVAACNTSFMGSDATVACAARDASWGAMTIVGTGLDADFVAVQGDEVLVVRSIGFYCCGGDEALGDPTLELCQCGSELTYALMVHFDVDEPPPSFPDRESWDALFINALAERMPLSEYFDQLPGNHRPIVAAASGGQFAPAGALGFPDLLFSDYTLYVDGKESVLAAVFRLPLVPSSLSLVSSSVDDVPQPTATATLSGALSFTLQLTDAFGTPCPIDNDVFLALEEECAEATSTGLLNVFGSAGGAPATGAAADDCVSFNRTLFGEDQVTRVSATPVYSVTVSSIGFATGGTRRMKFVHLKSGMSVVSKKVIVKTASCGKASTAVQTCVSTCTLPDCAIKLRKSAVWMQVSIVALGRATFNLQANLVQPCCHGHGLCCAGDASCTRSLGAAADANAFVVGETFRCDCHADPVRGYWDRRLNSNCSLCLSGFSGPSCAQSLESAAAGYNDDFDVEEGEGSAYAFAVTPETAYDIGLEGDGLDMYVAWLSCPGQSSAARLQPNEVNLPCNGNGICVMLDSFEAACQCRDGFAGDDCSEVVPETLGGRRKVLSLDDSSATGGVLNHTGAAKAAPVSLTSSGAAKVMLKTECGASSGAGEACSLLIPEDAAFAVVRVMALQKAKAVLAVSYVGSGQFAAGQKLGTCSQNAEDGYWTGTFCDECELGFEGPSCTEATLKVCDDTTCGGNCTTREFDGVTFPFCSCPLDVGGVDCRAACNCSHGSCLPDGSCLCDSSEATGYWRGDSCDDCVQGYWGPLCVDTCTCLNGLCDTATGNCSQCSGNWDGADCDSCLPGIYGVGCTETCEDCERRNGICSRGGCICDATAGWRSSPTTQDCLFCSQNVTCNARGRCEEPEITDPLVPCVCYSDAVNGFWEVATNCTTCQASYWGPDCDKECRCNLRGVCNPHTGECVCYDDDTLGHYGGASCADCAEGYSYSAQADDCVLSSTEVEAKISVSFAVAPPSNSNNTRSGRGSVMLSSAAGPSVARHRSAATLSINDESLHRRSMATLSSETELALAAAGQRTDDILLVDAFVKPADSSVNFQNTFVRYFSVHAQTDSGDPTGDDVRLIFLRGDYVYFLVDASKPYIGRWPASDDMHAAPQRTGFAGDGFDEQSACNAQSRENCPPGTEVVHPRFGRGVVFKAEEGGLACVVAVDKTATCITTGLCDQLACGMDQYVHRVDSADIFPRNNVVWLGTASTEIYFSVAGWSYLSSSEEFVVTLNAETLENSASFVQKVGTSPFGAGVAFRISAFDEGGVDEFYAEDTTTRPWLLAFGRSESNTRIVVKVLFPEGGRGYDVAFLATVPVCLVYQCIGIDSVTPISLADGDNELLLALYVIEESGFRSLLWKLDLNNPKRDAVEFLPHPSCTAAVRNVKLDDAALPCEQARCFWTGQDCVWRQYALLKNETGSVGVTTMAVDVLSRNVYVALGLHTLSEASEVVKLSLSTLEPITTLALASDETVVALAVEPTKRALFATSSTPTGIRLSVLNMFDVVSVTPTVLDASGDTKIVVSGLGMDSVFSAFRMKIGDIDGNCTMLDAVDGITRLMCTTGPSEVASDCRVQPLDVTPLEEERWTSNRLPVRYIETPTVFELGSAQTEGKWADLPFLAGLHVPVPGPAVYHDLREDGSIAKTSRGDQGTFGPSTDDVGIIVSGSGFVATDTARCRINDTVVPATVLSAMRAVCVLKATNAPFSAPVDISMDGQVFSAHGPTYTSVGSPATITAFRSCSADMCEDAQRVTVQSSEFIRLNFTVLIKDANGVFLGDAWTGKKSDTPTATAAFLSPIIEMKGEVVVGQNRSMFVFDNVWLDRPKAGDFVLEFTYRPLFLRSSVVITVESGQPVQLRCVTEPAPFSNNRNPLTTQPVFAIEDASGNTVTDSSRDLYVRASLVNIDEHLFLANGQAAIEISEFTSSRAVTSGFQMFQRLTIAAVGGLSGKSLQYKEGAAPNEYEEVYFGVRFDVFSRSKGVKVIGDDKALMFQMRMVDCSAREVGHTLLAYVEPEELPTTSGTPVSIAGWEFFNTTVNGEEVSQYYCDLRHAGNSSFAGQVAAKFRDSCTLVCDPFPDAIRATPAMYSITPSMCCAKSGDSLPCVTARTGADCLSEHDTAVEAPSFNGTLLRADQYVRYIGKGAKMRLFNLNIPLPQFAVGVSAYTEAVKTQSAFISITSLNMSSGLGIRQHVSGDYINNQRKQSDFDYVLLQSLGSLVQEETVIRSSDWTHVVGPIFWEEQNEWQHAAAVRWLESVSNEHGSRFQLTCVIVDESSGLHSWDGAWVSAHDSLRQLESGSEEGNSIRMQVRLEIVPLNTTRNAQGLQIASHVTNDTSVVMDVEGSTNRNSHVRLLTDSAVTVDSIALKAPAAGTYLLRVIPLSTTGVRGGEMAFRVAEGLPHHVEFIPGRRPSNTLTNPSVLITQPAFVMKDVALNTVKEFPHNHDVRVRVLTIEPWPRCATLCTEASEIKSLCTSSKPGDANMWNVPDRTQQGLCPWNTPPLSNVSAAADRVRRANDPLFTGQGHAAFESLNIWAADAAAQYNITFEFYGAHETYGIALQPLSHVLDASLCASECDSAVCSFEPSEFNTSRADGSHGDELVLFGDYYDLAKAGGNRNRMKLRFVVSTNQSELTCDVTTRLRDACSVVATFPTCPYLCENVYPLIATAEDRISCCSTGTTTDGRACRTTSSFTTRSAALLQVQSEPSFAVHDTVAHRRATVLESDPSSDSHELMSRLLRSASNVAASFSVTCPSNGDCNAELEAAKSFAGPPRIGSPAQIGALKSMTSVRHKSASMVGPIVVELAVKDSAGTDVLSRDSLIRSVRVFVEARNGGNVSGWDSNNCEGGRPCLKEGDCDGESECVEFVESNIITLVGGRGIAKFYLHLPRARSYGIHVEDVSSPSQGPLLPSCSGPSPDGEGPVGYRGVLPFADSVNCATRPDFGHIYTFTVTAGTPHTLAWAVKPPEEVNNAQPQSIAYTLQVSDISGNILDQETLRTQGLVVGAKLRRAIRELRDPARGQVLVARRGEEWSEENLLLLEADACRYGLTTVDDRYPDHVFLSEDVISFTLQNLQVWHDVTCILTFEAAIFDENLNLNESLTDAVNEASDTLSASVTAQRCCEPANENEGCPLFAYSFEFGCWNHELGVVIDGPLNPASSPALAQVDFHRRYECLLQCGVCEEGMVCYGNSTLKNKDGWWREPVSYSAVECRGTQCEASTLGNGLSDPLPLAIGATPAADRARSDLQCGTGATGPLCGFCVREPSPEAPQGYARTTAACSKCPSYSLSLFLLVLLGSVVLLVILIVVFTNITFGKEAKETPKASVMVKVLLNHLQVSSLAAGIIRWESIAATFFDVEQQSSPGIELFSFDCVFDGDYYTKFVIWMLTPVVVVLFPFLVLLVFRLTSQKSGKKRLLKAEFPNQACECQSQYHWMYDWWVSAEDRVHLRDVLQQQKSLTPEQVAVKQLNIENIRAVGPRSVDVSVEYLTRRDAELPLEFTPHKIQRMVHEAGQKTVVWEAPVVLGEHGCWLCKSCCLLEQLFPSPGVGAPGNASWLEELVKGKWYTCNIPEHELTVKNVQHAFRDDLLDACLARLKLIERLRHSFIAKHNQPTKEALDKIAESCFGEGIRRKGDRKATSRSTRAGLSAKRAEQSEKLVRLAFASAPPHPVAGHLPIAVPDATVSLRRAYGITHTHLLPSTSAADPAREAEPDADQLSIAKKIEAALSLKSKETALGVTSRDEFVMTRSSKSAGLSQWKVRRTNVVTGLDKEWFTSQEPLTPPRSPTGDEPLETNVHLPCSDGKEVSLGLPAWYIEEAAGAREMRPLDEVALVSVPSNDGINATLRLTDVCRDVPYEVLYAAAQMRRTADKLQRWRELGYGEEDIETKLMARNLQETESEKVEPAFDRSRRGALDSEAAMHERMLLKRLEREKKLIQQDRNSIVIEECGLCHDDFAVYYCPHHDDSFCEACDTRLHNFGSATKHMRLPLVPKTSPLVAAGLSPEVQRRDLFVVSILVVIFMLYPSLVIGVSRMLDCSNNIRTDLETDHSYLMEDPRIDCNDAKYGVYRWIAVLGFVVYGFGLPLAGYLLLRRKRHRLRTKRVMSTLGFVYSGYRQSYYFWEMIIMLRKMAIVSIVVFFAKYPTYQVWSSIWVISVFIFLNIVCRPYKYGVLHRLENLSLITMGVTQYLALLYLDTTRARTALEVAALTVNVGTLAFFVMQIVHELKNEVARTVDKDGDGAVSSDELKEYIERLWKVWKPSFLRSRGEVKMDSDNTARKARWLSVDAEQRGADAALSNVVGPLASLGYWIEQLGRGGGFRNRFACLREEAVGRATASAAAFSLPDYANWWQVAFNAEHLAAPATPGSASPASSDVRNPSVISEASFRISPPRGRPR
ncbi:Laminin subunit alpha, partial [Diplonema papillatum]